MTFIAALVKLDSSLASTKLTNINIATHTLEATKSYWLSPCGGPSQLNRDTLIISLDILGLHGLQVEPAGCP